VARSLARLHAALYGTLQATLVRIVAASGLLFLGVASVQATHAQAAFPVLIQPFKPGAAPKGPTPEQIAKEQARLKQVFDEATIKDAAQAQAQGIPGMPRRIGPSITAEEIKAAAGDPAELSRAYQRGLKNPSRDEAPPVMIFASLSMPHESLLRLARSAATARVPMYFRGLAHGFAGTGMKRSMETLQPYVQVGAQILIHPDLFELYGVTAVPAVVITTAPRVGCSDESCAADFVKISGDVTLSYSLKQVADRKDAIGAEARSTLASLKPLAR
jgi:conjugal transfer pilus assembly protein TrbC